MDPVDYDVLNAVCLKKMSTTAAVARASGHEDHEVEAAVQRLVESELLVDVNGSYLPTDEAVPALEADAATRYATARGDTAVTEAADQFDPLNQGFLEALTAWQTMRVGDRQVPNDHSDPEYDDKVVAKVDRLVERLRPVLAAFEAHDPRFGTYGQRFDAALDEVSRGRPEFVSQPTVDSVHNVWFEFHEDLLRTLGRQRQE